MDAFWQAAQHWANTVLIWIGFGTVVGLIAKALMPGKDEAGTVVTLLMGIGGSIVGLGTLAYFWHGHRATPVSLVGFLAAIAGSSILLFFHRLLQGAFFRSDKSEKGTDTPAPRRSRRHAAVAVRQE
jgi:uncharacterized membrane protein YeaQ/YmgE (transglycosylase-associated protein family)